MRRKIVHRKPVAFLLYPEREDRANYLGVYCVELLECGHKIHVYPQVDSLTAMRRECQDCSSNVIEFPGPQAKSSPKQSRLKPPKAA